MTSRGPQHFSLIERLYKRSSGAITSHQFQSGLFSSQNCMDRVESSGDLVGHRGCVNAINFNVDGSLIVTGSDDKTVKIWNTADRRCITTLYGHQSNVFATNFLPHKQNTQVISGGNDADIIHYEMTHSLCTFYQHHTRKVLRLCINPVQVDTFMSCSADGTIRLFDIRGQYTHTRTTSFDKRSTSHNAPCVPQAMGGGKQNQHHDKVNESLLLDYKTRRIGEPVLYSVDIHPDGHHFIVGSSLGDVRLFDLRKIVDNNPQLSTVNIFRSQSPNCEITGCVFSHNGREIVCSHLCDHIYLYDTDGQYDPVKPEMEEEEDHEEQEIRIPVTQLQSLLRDDETDEEEDDPVEEEETEEVEPSQQGQSYKQVYKGHISRDTIKGVSFLGPNSEWIATGSDDARVYIWHKSTGKLATILEGHEDTVNTIVSHPTIPLFATGGIDSETKLWSMNGEVPTEEETEAKLKRMSKLQKRNRRPAAHAREMTFMLQILRHLVTQRQQNLM